MENNQNSNKTKNMYKLGKMVRHKTMMMEGYIRHSMFGVSVNGFRINDDGELVRFHTLGMTMEELMRDWQRVYKFKYIGSEGEDRNEYKQ